MKRRLVTVDFPLTGSAWEFHLDLPKSAVVVRTKTVYQAKKLIVAMAQPPLVPVLQIVLALDPDEERARRQFLILPEHVTVQSADTIVFVGSADDPNRPDGVMAIYEQLRTVCARGFGVDLGTDAHVYPYEGAERCECGETLRDQPEAACNPTHHAFITGSDWCMCGETRSDGCAPS